MNIQWRNALTIAAILTLFPGTTAQDSAGITDMDVALNASAMHWQPAPPNLPAGTQIVVLQGDPGKVGGVATIRLRFPAGAVVPPHFHSTDEAATIISGRFHVVGGDVLDKSKGSALTAGGFTTLMAGHHHAAWVDGVTVVQFSGAGPLDIHYLNPADDPSTSK
jgi:quercetin dioxygenase-like cupin family protein